MTSTWVENPHHAWTVYDNLNLNPHLQIHPIVIETDVDGEDESNNHSRSDHEGEDFSDPDVDEASNDNDDEGADNDENVYVPLIGNSSRGIVMHNDLGAYMSSVDPDVVHTFKFPDYHDIIHVHWWTTDPESEELFVGQQFANKDDYIFTIKWYSMKMSINYKVVDFKLIIYVKEC